MQDAILFWNAVALEANRISHSDPDKREQTGPVLSARALAIVHLAMYDALAGVTPGFPRYVQPLPIPGPIGASPAEAVAGAASSTLTLLYPAQSDFFTAQLNCFNTTNSSAFKFGEKVGADLVVRRSNDMDARDCGYRPSLDRGRHRRDPDNPSQGFHAVYYGAQTRTFAVNARHALARPPFNNGTDAKYLLALKDVRARGIRPDLTATLPTTLFNRRRTELDTLIGIYWGYDGANRLGTPPRLYNQIIRQVAMNAINPSLGAINGQAENARLFAFVNAAMGDAGILAWEQKYCHDFWRPVVGIREHDETMGPGAQSNVNVAFNDGDPGWLPLGAPSTNSPGMKNFTPDFPAYPSGHATFGAAALHITRMFYGIPANNKSNDNLFPGFFVSDEFNGGNRDNTGTVRPRHRRHFPGGLWQMIIENALSRVLLGVHWIFDAFDFKDNNGVLVPDLANETIGGVGLGLRIARNIVAAGNGNGHSPKMTPNNMAVPPIITPAPGTPMPRHPIQPASVGKCVDVKIPDERVGSPKKRGAKGAAKKGAAEGAAAPEGFEGSQAPAGEGQSSWPSGVSERDGDQSGGPGAWPSGVAER